MDSWELRHFEHSLKKRQKLALLLEMAGSLEDHECLLITCGDNSGALNHHFRAAGGSWSWAEMETSRVAAIASFLGEPVESAAPDEIPFDNERFDLVIAIDVHEHISDPDTFNREITRILKPGGRALLTTPNGDARLPLALLKRMVGMTPEVYGHHIQGYTHGQLEQMARVGGLTPISRGAYSRFFTEGIELAVNFAYVKVLRRSRDGVGAPEGEIAPPDAEAAGRVGGAYRLYLKLFPLIRAVSSLDRLLPGKGGYAVAIAAKKPVA